MWLYATDVYETKDVCALGWSHRFASLYVQWYICPYPGGVRRVRSNPPPPQPEPRPTMVAIIRTTIVPSTNMTDLIWHEYDWRLTQSHKYDWLRLDKVRLAAASWWRRLWGLNPNGWMVPYAGIMLQYLISKRCFRLLGFRPRPPPDGRSSILGPPVVRRPLSLIPLGGEYPAGAQA